MFPVCTATLPRPRELLLRAGYSTTGTVALLGSGFAAAAPSVPRSCARTRVTPSTTRWARRRPTGWTGRPGCAAATNVELLDAPRRLAHNVPLDRRVTGSALPGLRDLVRHGLLLASEEPS